MTINVKLDEGAFMPEKAHAADAGYDIKTPTPFMIFAGQSAVVDTGIHVEIPRGYVGFLKSKSGLNVKNSITGEGVIDSGYTGAIKVKLYNDGIYDYSFARGAKIIQLVILPILEATLKQVDNLAGTERGDNGFGSTGV